MEEPASLEQMEKLARETPELLLESLRWGPDMIVWDPEPLDEPRLIWLKRVEGGIGFCCEAAYPCEHHKKMTDV